MNHSRQIILGSIYPTKEDKRDLTKSKGILGPVFLIKYA